MTPRRKKRLMIVGLILIGVAGATTLFLTAFRENLVYFYSPTEIARGKAPEGRTFRVGGLVKEDSLERDEDTLEARFVVTDGAEEVRVVYSGVLPDLFKEGQGVVANGQLTDKGIFRAEKVLAKHDENYMPPEAAEAMKEAGKMPDHEMADN